ncbi:MAG TPA: alginate lyase family protein [Pyrinomonadaceae bacterium]|nr:alginate lyase family protein [Pyrinomonadaceae bacterium]
MTITRDIGILFRGDIAFSSLPREFLRRRREKTRREAERAALETLGSTPARLSPFASRLSDQELIANFRQITRPSFSSADIRQHAKLYQEIFPDETNTLIEAADLIANDARWPVAGFGELKFRGWRRDPLGDKDWGLDYHGDVIVFEDDGADIRVLWELNRFGHAVTLALGYAITRDERYAENFFSQIDEWMQENPYGRGANWVSAMEAALRSINLLVAFDIFRHSASCSGVRLLRILQLFDQHGRFVTNNSEFSYISTSNHYLSNVVGLFWIGTLVPELENAKEWRDVGLKEMLAEIDKQILPDGADFESSTSYHGFVTAMLLYSFLLAERNQIEIKAVYWAKLEKMIGYIHGITRPDGRVPLIGDADGSRFVPFVRREANDQNHLVAVGATIFNRADLRAASSLTPEVIWLTGEKGVKFHGQLQICKYESRSAAFPDAGAYILRHNDLYLHFNANDCGVYGRGSHAHNDALSIEISAFGRPFIVDPGSYVYNLDREARHLFRSTGYHSTVMVDDQEQNATELQMPFVIGNEAAVKVISWSSSPETDRVEAEHRGYSRLSQPVTHRRIVEFDKVRRQWAITDHFSGSGTHDFAFTFHLAPDLYVEISGHKAAIGDREGRSISIEVSGMEGDLVLEDAFVSRSYGHREPSQILKWNVAAQVPFECGILVTCSV